MEKPKGKKIQPIMEMGKAILYEKFLNEVINIVVYLVNRCQQGQC